jgi:hypothetical protein
MNIYIYTYPQNLGSREWRTPGKVGGQLTILSHRVSGSMKDPKSKYQIENMEEDTQRQPWAYMTERLHICMFTWKHVCIYTEKHVHTHTNKGEGNLQFQQTLEDTGRSGEQLTAQWVGKQRDRRLHHTTVSRGGTIKCNAKTSELTGALGLVDLWAQNLPSQPFLADPYSQPKKPNCSLLTTKTCQNKQTNKTLGKAFRPLEVSSLRLSSFHQAFASIPWQAEQCILRL